MVSESPAVSSQRLYVGPCARRPRRRRHWSDGRFGGVPRCLRGWFGSSLAQCLPCGKHSSNWRLSQVLLTRLCRPPPLPLPCSGCRLDESLAHLSGENVLQGEPDCRRGIEFDVAMNVEVDHRVSFSSGTAFFFQSFRNGLDSIR